MFHFASVFTEHTLEILYCTVSFFFPIHRQSRSSGCKVSKSVRDFGCPGKYCTGPACSDDEQPKLEKVEELANTESTPPTNRNGANYSASSQPMHNS